jgi:hypothetical protein
MKLTVLSAAAVSMVSAVALAQPAPGRSTPSQAPAVATAPAPAAPSSQDTAAASGNSNQTVATTKGLSPDNCIIRLAASGRRYSSSHRGSWRVGC